MAKIVHITTVHPALDIRIFQKQCRTLARAGHEITLIAPRQTADQIPQIERIEGVVIHALPMPKSRRQRMLCSTRLALRAALAIDADLYHLHDPELLVAARRLRGQGRPVVFDMHENLPKDLLTKPWIPAPLRRPASLAASLAERFLLARLAVVLAEDSYAADHAWLTDATVVRNMPLIEELPVPVEQLPVEQLPVEQLPVEQLPVEQLPVEQLPVEQLPVEPSATPTVGYMGSISAARGSLATLEALGILRRQGLDCGLELVGPISNGQTHAAELMQTATRLGLDDVRISGWLPPHDAWRRIAPCRVGLALLEDRPNFRHSLPTKMLEYMAMGLPVVVSDFPLYRKIVEPAACGLCVDPADPPAIAAALGHLLKNPEEATAMGRRGRQTVLERYRWDAEARRLLSLYDRLLVPMTEGRRNGRFVQYKTTR